ncbi:MAG: glycosyl hydrolase, partial [Verrucomicrobia bacterium 21-51-4]
MTVLSRLEDRMPGRVTVLFLLAAALFAVFMQEAFALGAGSYVTSKYEPGGFVLSASGKSAPLCVSSEDYWGVAHAVKDLQSDIEKVTGAKPELSTDGLASAREMVIAGTIGKSPLIDKLISNKKLDVREIDGKWESFIIKVVTKPFPGVDRALVIVGSDKRGTIYGIYDVSEKIGVSPWHWWADVPPRHLSSLYVKSGTFEEGPPSVKYRGIFLNDEWPDLTNWMIHTYGYAKQSVNPPVPPDVANYGHLFYERVFDLLLRLKADYLWPAMWNNAFNEDDTLNPRLANEYGIVMGTSHQEPMI